MRSTVTLVVLASCGQLPVVSAPGNDGGMSAHGLLANAWSDLSFRQHRCAQIDDEVNYSSAVPRCGLSGEYAMRWTGLLEPSFTEPYTLSVSADDGARLFLDDKLILDAWRDQSLTVTSVQVPLQQGQRVRLQLDYYNRFGAGAVKLSWKSARQPEAPIPREALTPDDGVCQPPTRITALPLPAGSLGVAYNAATRSLAYSRVGADGYFDAYLADADGMHETPLTNPRLPGKTVFVQSWHPSGKYLFLYVEKGEVAAEPGHTRAPIDATPGYGAYTDLWLISRDGSMVWPLTDFANDYDHGVIHAAVSMDGTRYAWSERVKRPGFGTTAAGSYVFKVADFVEQPTPHFANLRTFQPGGVDALNELDGFSPDNRLLAFYSSFESSDIFHTPIYTLDLASGHITRLTEPDSYAQAAQFTPDGRSIIYMSGSGVDTFPLQLPGADWWIMNADGTNRRRLTFMNSWNHAQSVNAYRLAGAFSFETPTSFYGTVMTQPLGLVGTSVKVTCNHPPN